MKKKNLIIGIIIAVCLICIVVLGVLQMKGTDKKSAADTEDKKQEVVSTLDELRKEKGSKIETPYCSIYFPTKWKEQVKLKRLKDDPYTVKFYGIIEGKDAQHLFDIQFGGTEGFELGTLTTEDGTEVTINAIFAEDKMDDSWTEEEKLTIYEMQEDINYIIAKLEEVEGFQSAQ